MLQLKRAYEEPEAGDGRRVLVDRLWPRGLRKADARIDTWLKTLAPSPRLRRWFGHDPARWQQFQERYRAELLAGGADVQESLLELARQARGGAVTLVYAARDEAHNNAIVLKGEVSRRMTRRRRARRAAEVRSKRAKR